MEKVHQGEKVWNKIMANQHTQSSISFGPLHTLEYIMRHRFKLLIL